MADAPTFEELSREVAELKRRLDETETRVSQTIGQFEFISSQLRDAQLFTTRKFVEVDSRLEKVEGRLEKVEGRLDRIDGRLGSIESEIKALPRVMAEIIRESLPKPGVGIRRPQARPPLADSPVSA